MCNPHDITGLKETILRAIRDESGAKRRRMSSLRRRVRTHDVQAWAGDFLAALDAAPDRPVKNPPRRQES